MELSKVTKPVKKIENTHKEILYTDAIESG
jgi:hypothetical protein